MMIDVIGKWYCIACAAACVSVVGCGGQAGVQVTGKVVDGGQPIVIGTYEEGASCLEVDFQPLDEAGNSLSDPTRPAQATYCKEDGSFVLEGYDGTGIPPGKYRVSVRRRGETPNGPGDVWNGKFDGEKSPFVFDVTGKEEIVIDIAKANTG